MLYCLEVIMSDTSFFALIQKVNFLSFFRNIYFLLEVELKK